jgi:putative membrane protein insertion efficiency factor
MTARKRAGGSAARAFRSFARDLILWYQRRAPSRIRNACRFEPTCSNYMLLAIDKHGVAVGTLKGLRRICRCRPPAGGVDYP